MTPTINFDEGVTWVPPQPYAETTPATTSSRVQLPEADRVAALAMTDLARAVIRSTDPPFMLAQFLATLKELERLPWHTRQNLLHYAREKL